MAPTLQRPDDGITTFGTGGNNVELATGKGGEGVMALNARGSGWDFFVETLGVRDIGVIAGDLAYETGDGISYYPPDYTAEPLKTFRLSANDSSLFELQSFQLSITGVIGDETALKVVVTGYRDGVAVATENVTINGTPGVFPFSTISLTNNSAFDNIDAFTITPGAGSSIGYVGIDNINATNFHFPALPPTAPTDITLDHNTAVENTDTSAAFEVGKIGSTDGNTGDTFTYTVVGGADQAFFEIVGDSLRFKSGTVLDHETKDSYAVTVRSTDSGNLSFDKAFSITVTDINEAPVSAGAQTAQQARADQAFTYTVPLASFSDPDAGDTLTYTTSLADGNPLPAWLSFNAATRTFSGTPTSSDAGPITLRVTATDTGSLTASSDLTLTVTAAPGVASIVRAGGVDARTNANSLTFTVTFSEAVTSVDVSDFSLTLTDDAQGTVDSVTAVSGSVYTVAVKDVSGDGTLRLNLLASGTGIENGSNVAIGAGFTSGDVYTLDYTAPHITRVETLVASGTYKAGDDIPVLVFFSEAVSVTGTPTLSLNIGGQARTVAYSGGGNSGTQVFVYTVQAGDTASDLDYLGTDALSISGASIKDLAGNDSVLTLPAPGTANSLGGFRDVVIDGTAPVLVSAEVTGSQLIITYSEALDAVNLPTAGRFAVDVAGSTVGVANVAIDSVAKTVTLTLASAVAHGQAVTVAYQDPTVGDDSNAIQDIAGNDAASIPATAVTNVTPDTTPPVIQGVSIPDQPMKIGDVVTATITVAADTDVYTLGAGSTIGGFMLGNLIKTGNTSYTVQFTVSAGGTEVLAGANIPVSLVLTDTGSNSNLPYTTAIVQANDSIDPLAPVLVSAAVNGAQLVLTYDSVLSASAPLAGAFAVTADAQPVVVSSVVVDAVAKTVTLLLAQPVQNGQAVALAYTDPTAGNDANAIQDAAGNDALSLVAQVVVNNTPDTTAPSMPTIGTIAGNGVINALEKTAGVTLTGTTEAGSTVELDFGSHAVSATVIGTVWSYTLLPADYLSLGEGAQSLTVTASDAALNTRDASVNFLIDTQVAALALPLLASASDSGAAGDGITNVVRPVITGTGAEAGATIALYDTNQLTLLGTVQANGAGEWSITSSVLAADTHTLYVRQTDVAGNVSTFSASLTLDVRTALPPTPAAPVLVVGNDTGTSAIDGITQTTRPDVSGAVPAGSLVQIFDTDGTTLRGSITVGISGLWSVVTDTLTDGAHNLSVVVTDIAGNASAHSTPLALVIDTQAPSAIMLSANQVRDRAGANAAVGTLGSTDNLSGGSFAYALVAGVGAEDNAAFSIVNGVLRMNDPATAGLGAKSVRVRIEDQAGNQHEQVLTVTVVATPAPTPTTPTAPVFSDGVPVTQLVLPNGDTQLSVPVVTSDRQDDPTTSSNTHADISVVRSTTVGSLLTVGVPIGSGVTAQGTGTQLTRDNALTDVLARIDAVTAAGAGRTTLGDSVRDFIATLPSTERVVVETIVPVISGNVAPGQPLIITGSSSAADGRQVVVVDTRGLPTGVVLQVDNIDFVVIAGAARVVGGVGQNIAIGDDDSQFIVLGADDDVIHGAGANDTVGSLRGKDQTFGDAGDDVVYGGTDDDTLHGGTGNDQLNGGFGLDTAVQSGVLADYTVTRDGNTIVLTHNTSGEIDRLLDVEVVTFDSGQGLVIAHEPGDVAALTALHPTARLIELNLDRAVLGTGGDDTVTPALGIALNIDLGAGQDVVRVSGTRADVHLDVEAGNRVELTRLVDGAMLAFHNVETIAFDGAEVTVLAHNLNEAVVGRAYELLLNRNVDAEGYGFWIEGTENGVSLLATLDNILSSQEYLATGSHNNSAFVELLYQNGLNRASDAAGKAFWVGALDAGVTRAQVLQGFASSAEAVQVIGSTIDVTVVS